MKARHRMEDDDNDEGLGMKFISTGFSEGPTTSVLATGLLRPRPSRPPPLGRFHNALGEESIFSWHR